MTIIPRHRLSTFDTSPGQIQPAQTGPEDNIVLKIFERGGTVTSPNAKIILEISSSLLNEQLAHMVSGDTTKAFEVKGGSPTGVIFRLDLGERFGVNRIKFFPRKGFEEFFLKGYELLLNDGSEEQKTLAGTPDFKVFKTEERNLKPTVDLTVPLQFVRFHRGEATGARGVGDRRVSSLWCGFCLYGVVYLDSI